MVKNFKKQALITDKVHSEWTTFRHYIAKQPKEDMSSQCLYVTSNGTASVERSFSQMKMIKTQLRNRLSEKSLSYLMKIAIESPQKLTDEDLEMMIGIGNRKARRIVV